MSAACILTNEASFTAGASIEVGGELGLGIKELSVGVSGSYTTTEESGQADGAQMNCPKGPWYCALVITPAVTIVKGIKQDIEEVDDDRMCAPKGDPQPWTAFLPQTKDGKLKSSGIDVCACPDYEHWADPGAPSIVCPQPCNDTL